MASRGSYLLLLLSMRNQLINQMLQDLIPIPLPEWRHLIHEGSLAVGGVFEE